MTPVCPYCGRPMPKPHWGCIEEKAPELVIASVPYAKDGVARHRVITGEQRIRNLVEVRDLLGNKNLRSNGSFGPKP